jgi:hypothetical protein
MLRDANFLPFLKTLIFWSYTGVGKFTCQFFTVFKNVDFLATWLGKFWGLDCSENLSEFF